MTEKQFRVSDIIVLTKPNTICDGDIFLNQKEVCNLLNKLNEENKKLKKEIGNLEHTRDFCIECCEQLEKENEHLKSEIKEVRGKYEQLWMRL